MISDEWICDALALRLKQHAGSPLQQLIYTGLRGLIEQGHLPAGQRLPSSRQLAQRLQVARNTALAALEQLTHEGFVDSRQGKGSFVAAFANMPNLQQTSVGQASKRPTLSRRGQSAMPQQQEGALDSHTFMPGLPALSLFPWEEWRKLLQRHLRRTPEHWLNYSNEGGLFELRRVLCDYLRLARSVNCSPEQIIITQGVQQGYSLIAQLLADAGDTLWFENPGYEGARAAFRAADLVLEPVPVDQDGMQPDTAHGTPRLVYVTPSYQYPCAVTLSLERRRRLLQLAEQHDALIIEDDYDSEFRYDARPLASMQGLGDGERVIYAGTFSKVMYPGLGLGYLVVPRALADDFRRASTRLARATHYPLQAAVADFIAAGAFRRHINRCRHAYQQRQQALREALAPAVERGLVLSSGLAGMHLLATHPAGMDEKALIRQAAQHAIYLKALSPLYLTQPAHNGLILGYAAATPAEITQAGSLLAQWLS